MSKDNKKKDTQVTITPENVVDQRKAGNLLTPELKKMLDEQTKDEKDKQIIRETKSRVSQISYKFDMGLINLKKMRAMEQLALYNTRQQGRLQRFLTGFVVTEQVVNEFTKTEDDVLKLEKVDNPNKPTAIVIMVPELDDKGNTVRKEQTFKVGETVPAVIDYNEFDDGLEILNKNLLERQKKIEDTFKADTIAIQKAAGEYWSNDWVYNIRIVNGEGVKGANRW